ncbi:proteasome assembly chaperone 4 isoform 1-T1 [Vipera latastei]
MEGAQEPGKGNATERVSAPVPLDEEGGISLHNFCGRLAEHLVHFHAMRLQDSLFLWIGDGPELSNLAVAMCTPRDSIPASTLLFGNASDNTSNSLAQRLGNIKARNQVTEKDILLTGFSTSMSVCSLFTVTFYIHCKFECPSGAFIFLKNVSLVDELSTYECVADQ